MTASAPRWTQGLRNQLKREHGFGWSVREIRGRVQLTRRWEDDSRSTAILLISWKASCGLEVLNAVAEIRQRMEGAGSERTAPQPGAVNWRAIADALQESGRSDLWQAVGPRGCTACGGLNWRC